MLRDDFDQMIKSAGNEWIALLVVAYAGFMIVPFVAYFVFLALAESSQRIEALR